VFVWSNLSDGEPHFTLSQVALNDLIMVFAFAPIVGFLLGLSAITVPWETLLLSVVLYIVVPVIIVAIWQADLGLAFPYASRMLTSVRHVHRAVLNLFSSAHKDVHG
jgi:ACR3 family arsenite transporter